MHDGTPVTNHETVTNWVRGLCGGVTVCPQVSGQWVGEGGKLYVEPMLPIRVVTHPETILRIATTLRDTYRQECIFVAKLGEVMFV